MVNVEIAYYDNNSDNRKVLNEEVPFPEGKLIVSRTDLEGKISHCNQAFIEMSGFTEDELIGQPHYILRHPDMPSAAFKDLWETVQARSKWSGYVKNLRKDGKYYWVYAVVVPNIRDGKLVGFASVRRKPSRTKIDEYSTLYKKMITEDKS